MINNYLNYNPIQNQNQGVAAYRLLLDVPDSFAGKQKLLQKLTLFLPKLPAAFIDYYNQRISDSPLPINTQTKVESHSIDAQPETNHFDYFWQLQIRREKKSKAQDIWNKLGLDKDGDRAMHIIHCWEDQKRHRKQYQDKTKTPLPHNWLADEQWLDEFIRADDPSITPN